MTAGMKIRFHGEAEWHLPRPNPSATGFEPATLCGVSLANANTFAFTFRKLDDAVLCPRCLANAGTGNAGR